MVGLAGVVGVVGLAGVVGVVGLAGVSGVVGLAGVVGVVGLVGVIGLVGLISGPLSPLLLHAVTANKAAQTKAVVLIFVFISLNP